MSYCIRSYIGVVKKQLRRGLGKYLRKLREERGMPLSEVAAYLPLYRVDCSKSNLARIEQENTHCRSDILAGLSLIYGVSTEEILFRGTKTD